MNIKHGITPKKPLKDQLKETPIVHPLSCFLPIYALFIFIIYWFIFCPLLFVFLYKLKKYVWPHNWPFYFWFVALLTFIIFMEFLVFLWRYLPSKAFKQKRSTDPEANLLMNNQHQELYTVPVAGVKKREDFSEKLVTKDIETASEIDIENGKIRKEIASSFPQYSYQGDAKSALKVRPKSLAMPHKETTVELHSTTSPLSPRELFFWDLIQNANKSNSSITHDFIEKEKQYCSSLDDITINSPISPTEYFIANVSDRHSETSEVYLYIDEGTKSTQLEVRLNQIFRFEDDDVFNH